ncbi:hypothetical protein B0A52_08159 [Exophiala mesophila]|uniref:5-formyltetrahydrofolate cyclo-ligase n=1 Tax=Exophiala mesophila TaxID=212818 RepID=A0A438MV55_EXOME|nr:hypothetical protein B0A52_08159 [Exophiala mesophila]
MPSKMSISTLREQKTVLRKRIQSELKQLSPQEIQRQSAIITQKVLQSPVYKKATSLAIFLSMPGREVSTREIVLQALKDEKHVYVPYLHKGHVSKGKTMDMLKLHDRHDFESLVPDAWGIPSLSPDTVLQRSNALGGMGVPNEDMDGQGNFPTLDVIYMPAVAFDHSRQRLGHGKGFYDRYLHTYRTCLDAAQQGKNMPFLVGIALRQQILSPEEKVPVNDDDWPVDEVLTAHE